MSSAIFNAQAFLPVFLMQPKAPLLLSLNASNLTLSGC